MAVWFSLACGFCWTRPSAIVDELASRRKAQKRQTSDLPVNRPVKDSPFFKANNIALIYSKATGDKELHTNGCFDHHRLQPGSSVQFVPGPLFLLTNVATC